MSEISFYRWLSADPPVLFHSIAGAGDVGEFLPAESMLRLAMSSWYKSTDQWKSYYTEWTRRTPEHELRLLVNDADVCEELQQQQLPAFLVSQNSFIDERRFQIQPEIPKQYDVVYNARMSPFKRHHLLVDVPSALMIGGIIASQDSEEYFAQVRSILPQATFTHHPVNHKLRPEEVATHLNRARVGVCLSEVEGAMFACTEYLLCGLPVVSTFNRGGRNVWLDPEFSCIVEPDSKVIASAVRELAARRLNPQRIRAATIAKMTEHRRRFTEVVQNYFHAHNVTRDFAREFYETFRNQCGSWRPPGDVMKHMPPR